MNILNMRSRRSAIFLSGQKMAQDSLFARSR